MKIQKGIVKYKDRDDIVCTYGITDDNRQYYFMDENDEKKFRNGNRIASKDLKEAIDPMVKAVQVGVVDASGNEVIPFVNRTIRPVNDDIILIEVANPVSQSVIDAIALKSDPSAATKLVSTTSTIKDKLNKKMENGGRFIFNDMFSEATVCDINGNNLVNGEYYSFIGLTDNKLYFSKNTVDSEIVEYSILPPEVQSDITATNDTNDINVSNVAVSSEVVENALTNETGGTDNTLVSDAVSSEVDNNSPVANESSENATPAVGVVNDNNANDSNVVETPPVSADAVSAPISVAAEDVAAVTNPVKTVGEVVASESVDNTETPNETASATEEQAIENDNNNSNSEEIVKEESEDKEIAAPAVEEEETSNVADNPKDESSSVSTVSENAIDTPPVVEAEETSDAVDNKDDDNLGVSSDSKEDIVTPPVVEEETAPKPAVISPEEVSVEVSGEKAFKETKDEVDSVEDTSDTSSNVFNDKVEGDNSSNSNEKVFKNKKVPFSSVLSDIPEDIEEEKESSVLDKMFQESSISNDDFDQDMQESIFEQTDVKADRISSDEEYNDSLEEEVVSAKDTIMVDIAKSMSNLMSQNRKLKANLAEVKTKLEKISLSRRNIANKAKILEQKNDILNTKLHNEETLKNKANSKVATLEAKVREQERIIASQTRELNTLRPQLQGKDDLVKLLADASLLLDDDGSSSYDDDKIYN